MLSQIGEVDDFTYLQENSFEYPVSINGKTRTKCVFPLGVEPRVVEEEIRQNEVVLKWTEGKEIRKVVYVPGRIINIVI